MVPDLKDEKVIRLLLKIKSHYNPTYVPVIEESYAKINDCFPSVEKKIAKNGGAIIYGWQIWKTELICEAEFHAVWKSNNGELIDITPKNPPVNEILFVQDDNTKYKGIQIDNIRINNTQNQLVNDLIDIHRTIFMFNNRNERAFSYEIKLNLQDVKILDDLENFKSILFRFIKQGGEMNSPCFCGKALRYSDCHRNNLEILIMNSKK